MNDTRHIKKMIALALTNEIDSIHSYTRGQWYIDKDKNLVRICHNKGFDSHSPIQRIPAKHVMQAWKNLQSGMAWDAACVIYELDREQIATIVAHFHKPNCHYFDS